MFEMLMMLIEACGCDVDCDVEVLEDGSREVRIDIDDFEGFDDDWSEIMRDYEHPAEVEALEDWLEEHGEEREGDLYSYYQFEGFSVCLGYSSFDI